MIIEEKLNLLVDKFEKIKVDRAAIISAIREKGVSIPDNTLLQDIPPYILMIEGGEQEVNKVINEILYLIDGISYIDSDTLIFLSGASIENEILKV